MLSTFRNVQTKRGAVASWRGHTGEKKGQVCTEKAAAAWGASGGRLCAGVVVVLGFYTIIRPFGGIGRCSLPSRQAVLQSVDLTTLTKQSIWAQHSHAATGFGVVRRLA